MTALTFQENYFVRFKTNFKITVLLTISFSLAILSVTILLGLITFLIETYKTNVFYEDRKTFSEISTIIGWIWIIVLMETFIIFTIVTAKYGPIFGNAEEVLKEMALKTNPIAVYLYWPYRGILWLYRHAFVEKDIWKLMKDFSKDFFLN